MHVSQQPGLHFCATFLSEQGMSSCPLGQKVQEVLNNACVALCLLYYFNAVMTAGLLVVVASRLCTALSNYLNVHGLLFLHTSIHDTWFAFGLFHCLFSARGGQLSNASGDCIFTPRETYAKVLGDLHWLQVSLTTVQRPVNALIATSACFQRLKNI
jgi:hypothetical protein